MPIRSVTAKKLINPTTMVGTPIAVQSAELVPTIDHRAAIRKRAI
jgi:hypothetical protein